MSYLTADRGKKSLKAYLKSFKGASERVYRSEIQQFFDFADPPISKVTGETLHEYHERIARDHTPKTPKRKFSILNGLFKVLKNPHGTAFS